MKKITMILLLAGLAQVADAREIKFKDGTVLNAQARRDGAWAPDALGLVLNVGGQIYIHHYPATPNAVAPPLMDGDNVPARILYRHFTPGTLRDLHEMFARENSTAARAARQGIAVAFNMPPNQYAAAHAFQTARWQRNVEDRISHRFRDGSVVWGRLAALPLMAANTTLLSVQQGTVPATRPLTIHPITGLPIARANFAFPTAPQMATRSFEINSPAIQQFVPPPLTVPYVYDNCLPGRRSFLTQQPVNYPQGYYQNYRRR